MNVNFQKAQDQFNMVLDKLGTEIQFLQRTTTGSNAFDTGSSITYGYGDITESFTTGSIKAIITKPSATDIVMESGFYGEDFSEIKVRFDSTIEYWSQVIIPSGSGIKFLILPVQYWIVGGITIYKFATIRRLVPRSDNQY